MSVSPKDDVIPDKVLVVCLDADNDIERKTGLKTPIMGRDELLSTATRMALADPEEADANAIFAAVSNYDKFVSMGCEARVAIVSGDPQDNVFSAQKMVDEVKAISKDFDPKSTVVVTDGFGDEDIIPVLTANLPLSGIIRVVIKHSQSVEESYIVFGRYLKMLFTDRRFKRYSLGIPGIILVLLPMLAYIGRVNEALLILSISIGASAFIKALDLDRTVSTMLHRTLDVELPSVQYVGMILFYLSGVIFIIAALALGITGAYDAAVSKNVVDLVGVVSNTPLLIGEFIKRSALFFVLGFAFLVGRDFITTLHKTTRESRTRLLTIAAIASLYPFLTGLGDALISFETKFLSLVFNSLISLLSVTVASAIILVGYRLFAKHLKRP